MAGVTRDIKGQLSNTKAAPSRGPGEQTFHILPHPAKSNNPADLQKPSEETGGLQTSQGAFEAFKAAPGPVLPNQDMLNNLPPPKTREELDALQAELNRK